MSTTDVRIRQAISDDLSDILAVENEVFSSPWTSSQVTDELEAESGYFFLAEKQDEKGEWLFCGFIMLRWCLDEAELLRIAVRSGFQRQGIAGTLLHMGLLHMQKLQVKTCFLEVRAANQAARFFYQAKGFDVIGLRKKYYRHPLDDALVMSRQLDLSG